MTLETIIVPIIITLIGATAGILGARNTATKTINDGWCQLTKGLRDELDAERAHRERLEGRLEQVESDRDKVQAELTELQCQYRELQQAAADAEEASRTREGQLLMRIEALTAQVNGYEQEIARLKACLAERDKKG